MIIAAHIDTLNDDSFVFNCIKRLSVKNKNDHFIIFIDKKSLPQAVFTANCTLVTIKPPAKNSLLLHYWYNCKLPYLLKKYNAAVFISQTGAVSINTTTAQIMIITDDFFLYKKYPVKKEYAFYLKKYFLKFTKKAAAICVTKPFIYQTFISRYAPLQHKTTIVLHGLNKAYHPIAAEEKEAMIEKYSAGFEYFICDCSTLTQANITTVLKAFSIFKKKLKSGMRIIVLNSYGKNPIKDFSLYKYRQQVHIIDAATVLQEANIIAAAYAAIYLPVFISATNWGLHCMAAHVPLLTCISKTTEAIYADAALYTSIDETAIAENMMLLYKDEKLRNNYIQKAAAFTRNYNWDASTAGLWQTILQNSRV